MIAHRVQLNLTALILLWVFAWGCSSSDGPTKVQQTRISDVGEFVSVHEYDDGIIKEYLYLGVPFWGDMLVSEYELALEIAVPRFAENEVLLKVSNSRVIPESQNWGTQPEEGFILTTCTTGNPAACNRGNTYIFDLTVDGFGLQPVLGWFWISK